MTNTAAIPTGKLAYATPETAPMVEGRRSFLKYQDLGVTAASSGRMRAQVMSATEGMTKPTGWHYHVCDGQFVYVLKGWVDLQFEDGQKLRVRDGESLYIPGGPSWSGSDRTLGVLARCQQEDAERGEPRRGDAKRGEVKHQV